MIGWAIFILIVIVILWSISFLTEPTNQFPIAIEKQARVLAGFTLSILGFTLTGAVIAPWGGMIISSILTCAVWILTFYDKPKGGIWKWLAKLCMKIDVGYSSLALGLGVLVSKIPNDPQSWVWAKILLYALCFVLLIVTIMRNFGSKRI
jgi:hypothetical protein